MFRLFEIIRSLARRYIPLKYRIKIVNSTFAILNLPISLTTKATKLNVTHGDSVRRRIKKKVKQRLTRNSIRGPLNRLACICLERLFSKKLNSLPLTPSISYFPDQRKVLLVIGTLGGGGAERQLVLLALQLKVFGWEPVVVVKYLDGEENRVLLPLLTESSVKVLNLYDFSYAGSLDQPKKFDMPIFDAAQRLVEIIKCEKPSVVHSWMDYANCETLIAGTFIHIPKVILGLRSVSPDNFPLWSPTFRPTYQHLMKNKDTTLVCNSENGRKSYANWLGGAQIEVIPNGVVIEGNTGFLERNLMRHDEKQNVIGCLRLSWEKGPDLWIEVARMVCERDANIYFHLFGVGPLRQEIEKTIRINNLERRVVLHGFQKNPWILKNWDLHLSTSRIEGLPNVVIEASLHGIPTAAFNVGGIPEILGKDSDSLVKPFDIELMAEKVVSLLNSHERRLIEANRARNYVKNQLNLDLITRRYVILYESKSVKN